MLERIVMLKLRIILRSVFGTVLVKLMCYAIEKISEQLKDSAVMKGKMNGIIRGTWP